MQYLIFKHTRNKENKGHTIWGVILFMLSGVFCISYFDFNINNPSVLWCIQLMGVVFILSSFYGLWLILRSFGVIIQHGKLSTATFIFGEVHKTRGVDESMIKGVDILKFDYRSYDQDSDHVGPDLTSTDFKVYLLNESHSKRKLICQTMEKDEAELVTQFLIDKLGIQRVKYNPPTARRRKRRR